LSREVLDLWTRAQEILLRIGELLPELPDPA
jgi:hypothetical protein